MTNKKSVEWKIKIREIKYSGCLINIVPLG